MLEQGEIITLNDKKTYVATYVDKLNDKNYVYLVEQDDYTNNMWCEQDSKNGLQEVVNEKIVEKLLARFKMNSTKQ